LTSIPKVY